MSVSFDIDTNMDRNPRRVNNGRIQQSVDLAGVGK